MNWVDPVAAHYRRVAQTSVHAPSANTPAVVTLAARPGFRHYLLLVAWSYNAEPTNGALTITGLHAGTFAIDITTEGPGPLWLPPAAGLISTAVVVTLAAGGAGVTGKVNVLHLALPAHRVLDGQFLVPEEPVTNG